jgi:hypothetical protein
MYVLSMTRDLLHIVSNHPFGLFQATYDFKHQVTLNCTMEDCAPLYKRLDVNDDCIVDVEGDIFYPVLVVNPI